MSRLQLPQVHVPRSRHLVQFEQEFEALNSFYWVYRSATALMLERSRQFSRTTEFVPQPEASHLDIACGDLTSTSQMADRVARYGILVQVITYYEVYLSDILSEIVSLRWPGTRQVMIKLRPSDLPSGDINEYIKSAAISAEVGSVIDETYSKRLSRITNLLTSCGFPEPDQNPVRKEQVTAACEVRNCIVHCGGKADERAKEALQSMFPGLSIGAQLELDETSLWKLLGAVRDDARAIDFAIRKKSSDRRIARIARRKRYYARRKAKNIAEMQKHRNAGGNGTSSA